jgi:ribosomal protein S18 acetylase RimI-like enzyme
MTDTRLDDIALRVAQEADAAALVALVNSAYRGDSSRAGWTTEADLLAGQRTDEAALREFIAGGSARGDAAMLLHEDAAGPLACVQLERRGERAYLGMLTIRPTAQAAGLGRALLAAAERHVRDAWGSRAIVMTVIEQRDELIAWYERRGYARTGRHAPFPYGDARFGEPKRPDLRFVVLEKRLEP